MTHGKMSVRKSRRTSKTRGLFLLGCPVPDEVIQLLPEVVEVVAGQDRIVDVSSRRIKELQRIESGAA